MNGWLFESLLVSALLMTLVLAIREPVARIFGARAAFALWLAPLVRMLWPPLPADSPFVGYAIEIVPETAAPAPVLASTTGLTVWDAMALLWLAGAAGFLAFHLFSYRRFLQSALSSGRRLEQSSAFGPELIESVGVRGPIATGIIRKRIFLPAGFTSRLSPDQRRLAIAHEELHHSRGDLIALTVSLIVLALHWFNPLAHLAHRAFRRDLEAACDAQLIEELGTEHRENYARAIVGCTSAAMPTAICALTPIDDLKRRLHMLSSNHGAVRRLAGMALAGTVAVAGLMLASPATAVQPKDEGETKEFIKRIEIHKTHGDKNVLKRGEAGEFRTHVLNCDGEKFEASSAGGADNQKENIKFFICAKGGESLLPALEKAAADLEKNDDMPAGRKADILAKLRAKIAELRAKG